jgi:hypothetical protein
MIDQAARHTQEPEQNEQHWSKKPVKNLTIGVLLVEP